MEIEKIKIFIAVYQAKSFAVVAKHLNVAPSSISRSLASLESDLNVRLFQRTTRKLIPTQEGELYYLRVVPLLEEFELLEQDLLFNSSTPSGTIRVTASTSYAQIVLAPLLKEFHCRYPDILIDLVLSDGRLDIISERIDLAIRHGSLLNSGLIARKLTDVNYILVATPEYLASVERMTSPQDIVHHPLVSFPYQEFVKQWTFTQGEIVNCLDIRPTLTISNAATIKSCIKNHFGIALLANWTVKEELKLGSLVSVLPEWSVSGDHTDNSIWLVQPSKAFVPEKVKVFKKFLLDKLNSQATSNA